MSNSKRKKLQVKNPHTNEVFNLEDLLSVEEVRKIFNVTNVTIYNWLGDCVDDCFYPNGKFPNAFKFEKEIYIPIKDVTSCTMNRSTVKSYERG